MREREREEKKIWLEREFSKAEIGLEVECDGDKSQGRIHISCVSRDLGPCREGFSEVFQGTF